ncbi:hypothetical protein WUBG_14518, partial [Wuchereria bancrofti]
MESKWAEVRTILLERKGDISRKTSDAESVTDGEQSSINQLKQMMDTINDLKNTVDKQAKQLELDKVEKRKFKTVIRQLHADKKALVASSAMENDDEEQYLVHEAQVIGLQRQLNFMDREITLLFTLNNSKDVLIQTLRAELESIYSTEPKLSDLRSENDRKEDDCIEHLQAQVKTTSQEESGHLNLLTKSNAELQRLQMHAQQLQAGYDRLQLQLQLSPERNLDAMSSNTGTYQRAQLQQAQQQMEFNNSEVVNLSMAAKLAHGEANKDVNIGMRAQMERLTEAVQQKDAELQKMLNENETLKMKFDFQKHSLLNDEKASMESKWAEVRTILLERKGDISRKTSDAESVTDGEQSSINQLKQMMDTINDLKNTVDKQAKQLELDKVGS